MWKTVVRDNKEPLVDIRKYCPDIVIKFGKRRDFFEKTAYLRLTVAKMLAKARRNLPGGYNFIINDAWRPAYVQASIYYRFFDWFRKKYPDWTPARVRKEIDEYVAPWCGPNVSGHMAGGAVDLRILDRHGRKLPMRSASLTYQENAQSRQPKLSAYLRRNRELLDSVMSKAGLSNYPKEYWHWSYGDTQWARRHGRAVAVYGPVGLTGYRDPYGQMPCPCCSIGNKEGEKKSVLFRECHGRPDILAANRLTLKQLFISQK